MIFLVNHDRHKVEADSPEELVAHLHAESLAQAPTDQSWMEQTAKRVKTQTGEPIRFDTAGNFIEDLIREGLVKQVTHKIEMDSKDIQVDDLGKIFVRDSVL